MSNLRPSHPRKKGKKSKGKTLGLSEFLGGDGGRSGGQAVVMAPSKSSWADEMDEEASYKEKILLPTAPRAARGSDVDESKIPCNPPYTAYIANLPYDIDNDDVEKFFQGLSVKSVRLPREGGDGGRLRGFGYAEFETRQDLVDALTRNELVIKNRKIRVDVASGTDNEQDQGMGGIGAGRGRGRPPRDESREDRTPNDWRNAPREMAPPDRFRSERGDRGGDRGGDREEQGSRYDAGFNPRERAPGASNSFGGGSSFGSRRDERGPSSFSRDRDGPSSFSRDRDGPSSFSRESRDRNGPSSYGRDRDGPSSFGRDRDGPSSFSRDREAPSMNREREPAKERPKLSLQPRTVPVDESAAAPAASAVKSDASDASAAPSSASIFGGAKPVDTAARERAIEERLKRSEKEREPVRGRESDRHENRPARDGSRGSCNSSDRVQRGRSAETEEPYRKDQEDGRRDNPVQKSNEYQAPRGGGGGDREYRAPRGGNDRDSRYSRDGERDNDRHYSGSRVNRGGNEREEPRRGGENGVYRPPNSSSRGSQQRPSDERTSAPVSSSRPSDDETRIRRMEEPKAPVFENRNKFAFLQAEDGVESEGQDDQE